MAAARVFTVVALIFAVLAVASEVSADKCPAFANAKSSCTAGTCGHFVFKGTFKDAEGKFKLAATEAAVASPAACCNQCRQSDGCAYWNFFPKTGACHLFGAGLCASEGSTEAQNDVVGAYSPAEADSYVGGFCLAPTKADTVGVASGDAKPLTEKAFCLVADKELHINMLLSGYMDPRTAGAPTVRGGMAVRTWIRELGFMWTVNGKSHSLRLNARRGAQQERGEGYLESIEVDGTAIPRLALGDELNLFDDQATLAFESYEKVGPYDVDLYKIKIGSMLEAEVRLRIAHPLLQLEGDAEVHMNMDILEMNYSPSVHGVLGQTYRDDRLDQVLNYAALSDLMSFSGVGDGRSTIQSLDGTADGYVSSSVLDTDCLYSQFKAHSVLPGKAAEGMGRSSSLADVSKAAVSEMAVSA